jgi:hypothetical protein
MARAGEGEEVCGDCQYRAAEPDPANHGLMDGFCQKCRDRQVSERARTGGSPVFVHFKGIYNGEVQ